jgi:hypothetical protein
LTGSDREEDSDPDQITTSYGTPAPTAVELRRAPEHQAARIALAQHPMAAGIAGFSRADHRSERNLISPDGGIR